MTSGSETQVVTFGLGDEVFAVSVGMVREILDYAPVFRVPQGPEWLLGLTELRGAGIPTVDLRTRMGLPVQEPTLATRILIVDLTLADRSVTLAWLLVCLSICASACRNTCRATDEDARI